MNFDRAVREEVLPGVTRLPSRQTELGERGGRGQVGSILRRLRKEVAVERAALGLRVLEAVVCLILFSVIGADKTHGWSGDSFDRYKGYKLGIWIILCVAIFGFCEREWVGGEIWVWKRGKKKRDEDDEDREEEIWVWMKEKEFGKEDDEETELPLWIKAVFV